MLRWRHWLPVVISVVLLAGCGEDGDESPPSPFPSPTPPSVVLPTISAPSEESVAPPPTPESSVAAPSQDPSTAGSLDASSLPRQWLGFTPAVVNPSEGEFNPNGSWVHGQDSLLIAQDAMPRCGDVPSVPVPTAALTGTYRSLSDAPGNGIALEFASTEVARAWFDDYAEAVRTCVTQPAGFEIVEMALDEGVTILDIRDYQGVQWAERVWLEDEVVRLMIVQGDFSLAQASEEPVQ